MFDSAIYKRIYLSLSEQLKKKKTPVFLCGGHELLEYYEADRGFFVVIDYPARITKRDNKNYLFYLVESRPLAVSKSSNEILRADYLETIAPSLKPSEYVAECRNINTKMGGGMYFETPTKESSIYPSSQQGYDTLESIALLIADCLINDTWHSIRRPMISGI